jgi:ferredoxin
MSLLNIDQKKCKHDGLCAADCPMGVIRFEGKGSYPEIPSESEPMCIRCGGYGCPRKSLKTYELRRKL